MAVTVNLKKQVDLPVWDWMRFAPATTSATSALCGGEGRNERYLYYFVGTFWRYDTWADSWQQLATPPVATATAATLRYVSSGGYRGDVLATLSSTTLQIAGLSGQVLKGYDIRIVSGIGEGQTRTITNVAAPVIHDYCVATTATANALTDSTKKWKFNQWVGYQVRVIYGTGASQIRQVLYNDATTLTFTDANFQQIAPWQNQPFSATAPFAAPVATAGLQANFTIESNVITVDSAWTTNPDATSSYCVESGSVWYLTANAAAPWAYLQYYDVASDTWYQKTNVGGQLLAAIGTDFSIERIADRGGIFESGTATAGGARRLTDTSKTLTVNRFNNFQLRITGGTGVGQRRLIIGNTATEFYIGKPWAVNPDATSTYEVYGDSNSIYLVGNAAASILKYTLEDDLWASGTVYDSGLLRQISAKYTGQESFGVTSIVRNTGGISTVASAPTAGGTNYTVGDILTITTGGTLGKVIVESITAGGIVASVSLLGAGLTYTTGAGKVTSGGTGTGCTVNITAISNVGRVTCATNHNLSIGDSVTIAGCNDAAWNTTYTVLGTDGLTVFDITTTAAATAVASNAISVTLLVDAEKAWTVNEHAGKVLNVYTAGTNPTMQSRVIVSNTANTLTLATSTTFTNGTSRYNIQEKRALARAAQSRLAGRGSTGYATSGSTTTLVDSTKSWIPNQWAGYRFRVVSGTGFDFGEVAITTNTATQLNFSATTFTPDATTQYYINDVFGIATSGSTTTIVDTTKNWPVNFFAGKRVRIIAGTGQSIEAVIASNTATTLTTGTMAAAIDTTSVYTILDLPARGTGITASWLFGTSDTTTKGQKLLLPRGSASNVLDFYNISSELCDVCSYMQPHTEVLTTGSMYAYDGNDIVYIQRDSTNRLFSLNVVTGKVCGAGNIPYGMSTAIIGSRMEVVTTEDDLKYLYIMRHSATELWRTLIFWE